MEIEEQFVQGKFRAYYQRANFEPPTEMEKREWGFGSWQKKIESRHVKFESPEELRSYLVRNTPFYISYSSAYYEFPEARPMVRKNWLGADLVFDLDANHLDRKAVPCVAEHGEGWACDACLSAVKQETIRLIEEFLAPDFGISKKEMSVNFSGNRGYHVHVRGEEFRMLSAGARREIVDYLTGVGLQYESIFFRPRTRGERRVGPKPGDLGWYGRVARTFINSLRKGELESIGISNYMAKKIYAKKEAVESAIRAGNWDYWLKMSQRDAQAQIQQMMDLQGMRFSDRIDQNVTADSTKLIRLPDSLHGETGMAAKRLSSPDALAGCEPFKDARVFGEQKVRVHVRDVPRLVINREPFGPLKDFTLDLPEWLAILLICKKQAFI
ncbi:MAG: DNA primase catalytic subunit PriS [Candidatus Micrarchaeota archaeon]